MPLPSVVYNGRTQATEGYRYKPAAGRSYQFWGFDDRKNYPTYHGIYHCVAVVSEDWGHLESIDQEVSLYLAPSLPSDDYSGVGVL